MAKQIVILAGGLGTRLKSCISDVPKPMAPINNIPFLDYLILHLKQNQFTEFIFLLGYKAEVIENYYKDKINNVKFIKEEKALGTAGAVFNILEHLDNEFFIVNGDTFFDIDYSLIENFSEEKKCTIALRYTNNPLRYGSVEIDDNYKVVNFLEKEKIANEKVDCYINSGIYFMKKEILTKYSQKNCFISLEKDIFPKMVKNEDLYGLPVGGCFIDIGIPEDYQLAQKIIPQRLQQDRKPALFIDKDGTIIENTNYPAGKNFTIIQKTVDLVKEYTDKNFLLVMVTNQSGLAKGKFTKEEMLEGIGKIQEYYETKGIIFDEIQYCPYHKDGIIKEFRKISLFRKPNPGMILQACEKLKIDLEKSVMVGDNPAVDKIKLPYLKSIII